MSDAPQTISGHQIELSEGRRVWVGEHDDSYYIRFVSAEGDERKLRISREASDALVQLLTAPQEIYRFILTIKDKLQEPQWEWVNAPPVPRSPQETAGPTASSPADSVLSQRLPE